MKSPEWSSQQASMKHLLCAIFWEYRYEKKNLVPQGTYNWMGEENI